MSDSFRNHLLGAGGLLVVGGGLAFYLWYDTRPFGLLPSLVEALLLAPIMPGIIAVSIALRSRFDQDAYVVDRGPKGLAMDALRVSVVSACFGIAVGLLLTFVSVTVGWRIFLTGITEYFAAFWVFALGNSRYYDDAAIRRMFGR